MAFILDSSRENVELPRMIWEWPPPRGHKEPRPRVLGTLRCTRIRVKVSPIGLGIILDLDELSLKSQSGESNEGQPDESVNLDSIKENVRRIALTANDVAAEHGFLTHPIVVVSLSKNQSEQIMRSMRSWSDDQQWHAGQFSFFVESRSDDAEKRLDSILSPEGLTGINYEPKTVEGIRKAVLEQLTENRSALRDGIQRIVSTTLEQEYRSKQKQILKKLWQKRGELDDESAEMDVGEFAETIAEYYDRKTKALTEALLAESNEGKNMEGLRLIIEDALDLPPGALPSSTGGASGSSNNQGAPPASATSEWCKSRPQIARILSARIQNFRGFRKNPCVDLDADLVLLLGANGHGKSSLMEGLLLGLCGHVVDEHQDSLRVANQQGNEARPSIELECRDANGGTITLDVKSEEDSGNEWALTRKEKDGLKSRAHLNFEKKKGDESGTCYYPGTRIEPELQYRLSAFLQDSYQDLFDEKSRGNTLRQVLEGKNPFISNILEVLGTRSKESSKLNEINGKLNRLTTRAKERLLEELRAALAPIGEIYAFCKTSRPEEWPDPPSDDDESIPEKWGETALRVLDPHGRLSLNRREELKQEPWDELLGTLHQRLKTHEEELKKARGATIAYDQELERIDQALKRLRPMAEQSRKVLSWLNPDPSFPEKDTPASDSHGQLTLIFKWLGDWADAWGGTRDPSLPPSFPTVDTSPIQSIIEELRLVDVSRAKELYNQLAQWEREHREAPDEVKHLEEQRADLEKQKAAIEKDNPWQEIQKYMDKLDVLRSGSALQEIKETVKKLQDWRKGQDEIPSLLADKIRIESEWTCLQILHDTIKKVSEELPSEIKNALNHQVETISQLFTLGSGLDKLELVDKESDETDTLPKGFGIISQDQRSLPHFSTGQRSQIAVSWMIAQRQLAQADTRVAFPHRVLLLDDVSTSYDLTNLVRESLLWRQLAYHPDESKRFQVILASHHNDLTNRLIDLLVPPQGYVLRVLEFTDWTSDEGPTIETYKVVPSRELTSNWDTGFARDFKEA